MKALAPLLYFIYAACDIPVKVLYIVVFQDDHPEYNWLLIYSAMIVSHILAIALLMLAVKKQQERKTDNFN